MWDPQSWLAQGIRSLLALAAILAIVTYALLAVVRLRYPFELEWMEGAMVDHVRHLLAGGALYGPPSLRFIAYDYPPLYFYVSAAVAALTGVALVPLRLVSALSSAASLWLIWRIVRRESGHHLPAIVATGLFAATFAASGGWFDLARVDSLYLALLLAAVYLARFHQSPAGWTLAAGSLLLAFLTKQAAVLVAAPLIVYFTILRWRLGAAIGLGLAAAAGGVVWVLDAAYHGWYIYYVFAIPARIQAADPVQAPFWSGDILGHVPLAFALAFWYAVSSVGRTNARTTAVYPLAAIGMIAAAWASRLHAGGYDNVLMPAHAALALLSGLAVDQLTRAATNGGTGLSAHGYVCCLVQFALLAYNPIAYLPRPADRAAGERLIEGIAHARGDVFVPQHGYLPLLAGKQPSAHAMAIYDIIRAGGDEPRDRLLASLSQALRQKRFAMIVLDRVDPWLEPGLDASYVLQRRAFDDPRVFWPVTGLKIRPELIYVPRDTPPRTTP